MKNLSEYSLEELQAAIEQKKDIERLDKAPKPLEKIDWTQVLEFAERVKESLAANPESDLDDSDWRYYMFEDVMGAIYGKGVFLKWERSRS